MMQAAARPAFYTLTDRQPKGALYWALLILSYFSIVNFVLRTTIGEIPGIGDLVPLWKEGLIVVLYLLWRQKAKSEGGIHIHKTPLHWTILITFIVFVLSVIAAKFAPAITQVSGIDAPLIPTLATTIDGLRVVFEPALYFLVLIQLIDTEDTLKMMIHGILIAAATIALYGILQRVMGVESPPSWTYSGYEEGIKLRVFSSIGNPNALAGFMVLTAPIAVSFTLWSKQWKDRLIYGAISLVLMITLVLTYSRGAWIGFVAGMVLYAFIIRNKKFLILFGIGVAGVAIVFQDTILNRLIFAFTPEYLNKSAESGRLAFWTRAFYIWKDNPVFGAGLGLVGDSVAVRHQVPGATWIDNQYVKLLAETGTVGILSYLVMLVTPLVQGWKYIFSREAKGSFLYALNAGIMAALFGMMVENVTAAILEDLNVATHFWVLIGLLYASIKIGAKSARAVK